MARKAGNSPQAIRNRAARTAATLSPASPVASTAAAPKKPFDPLRFAREVRAEARKITWTSRKETWITSVMVGIMVVIASAFFFGIDAALGLGVGQLLKLATAG